jgi:hypothetical protein
MDQFSSLSFDEKELNPLSRLLSKIVILKFITFEGSPVPHMRWWWRRPGSREMPLISESTRLTFIHLNHFYIIQVK